MVITANQFEGAIIETRRQLRHHFGNLMATMDHMQSEGFVLCGAADVNNQVEGVAAQVQALALELNTRGNQPQAKWSHVHAGVRRAGALPELSDFAFTLRHKQMDSMDTCVNSS